MRVDPQEWQKLAREVLDPIEALIGRLLALPDEAFAERKVIDDPGLGPQDLTLADVIRIFEDEYRAHLGQLIAARMNVAWQARTGSPFLASADLPPKGEVPMVRHPDALGQGELARHLADLFRAAASLVAEVIATEAELLDVPPREDEWSVREICQHLATTPARETWFRPWLAGR